MIDRKEFKELNQELRTIGKNLVNTKDRIPSGLNRELIIGANKIRNTVILSMKNTPKTGRYYRRGKSGKYHIASSPGNPPAIDYGELVRSIMFDVQDWEMEVGSFGGAPYAPFLEEGTFGKSVGRSGGQIGNVAPRPFLAPAVEKHRQEIIDAVGNAAFDVIKMGFK